MTKRSRWFKTLPPRRSAVEASTKAFNTERKPGAVMSTFRKLTWPALEAEVGEVWREGVRGVMRFKICSVKNDAIYIRIQNQQNIHHKRERVKTNQKQFQSSNRVLLLSTSIPSFCFQFPRGAIIPSPSHQINITR